MGKFVGLSRPNKSELKKSIYSTSPRTEEEGEGEVKLKGQCGGIKLPINP